MSIAKQYFDDSISFLQKMVTYGAPSRHEEQRCSFIFDYLISKGLKPERIENNILVRSSLTDTSKPTLMLNSHIDTVVAVESYSFDPLNPPLSENEIYGLGSNDAGGSVTSLLHVFLYFEEHPEILKDLNVNLLLLLTAEEECSGRNGIDLIMTKFPHLADFAIIGEPTSMQGAVAERGLLVIDAQANGKSGHAARNEGINALYIAIDDINFLRKFHFEKVSHIMGEVKISVTQITAGTLHNIIPDKCTFVVDIRPTDCYTNSEIMEILSNELKSELHARNLSNKSSATPKGHILMETITKTGITSYVSPTTSDWMRLSIPAIKMGPGESSRSHKADEFILKKEIEEGIETYINYIKNI